MFARTLLIAFALALVVAVSARTSDSAGPEGRYVVKRYDTLWSIASARYSGDPREGGVEDRAPQPPVRFDDHAGPGTPTAVNRSDGRRLEHSLEEVRDPRVGVEAVLELLEPVAFIVVDE